MNGRCATRPAWVAVGPVLGGVVDEVVEEFALVRLAARLLDDDPLHAVATTANASRPVSVRIWPVMG